MYTIYAHINQANHKAYVGSTILFPLIKRFGKNGSGYKNNKEFYKDIKKYGWNNFDHIILDHVNSKEEADNLEQFYIKQYNCIYPNGYNLTQGGTYGAPSEHVINKLRQINVYRWKNTPREEKQKIVEHLNSIRPKNVEYICPIYCIELDKIFQSPKYAADELGIFSSSIYKVCRKEQSFYTAGGYHWIFYSELENKTAEEKQKIFSQVLKHPKYNSKKILCLENNVIYLSARDAGDKLNISKRDIRKVCKGKQKSTHGYHFQYC